MIKATEEKKLQVLTFMKKAWEIDGEAEFMPTDHVRELLKTHHLNVIKMTDSKRGEFFIGTFKERNV